MKYFPRGSEWRKWDLHVHAPDTKLSNNFELSSGEVDWNRFCKIIHESDVYGIGITDYFSIKGYFTFIERYKDLYPEYEKVFFPNLELRLNEAVNGATEVVNFHIIFHPDLTSEQADEFLMALKTQITDVSGKNKSCANLKIESDYSRATVTREDIKAALKITFGDEAFWGDHVIMATAANNDGVRADKKSMRKMNLADEIDKLTDAFFGTESNTNYFLRTDRYDDVEQKSKPKPVFAGCDAHSFSELESWLGKEISDAHNKKCVTWIKADLTYEGLQQTLIEPTERVKIQNAIPDEKEPYRVISKISFVDSDFPNEVLFNPGLNAIIGSRSSGKSSLLAYIAHAIDPKYTVQQQMKAAGSKESEVGPGASITWDDVKNLNYKVEWAAPAATNGQVIYIPQNSLFAISERPEDVTAKIQPVVFRNDPVFEANFNKALSNIESKNEAIRNAVAVWFSLKGEMKGLVDEIRGFGDRAAITQRKNELIEKIEQLRASSSLTAEEISLYQEIAGKLSENDRQLRDIGQQRQNLSPFVTLVMQSGKYEVTDQVTVNINISPSLTIMPSDLQKELEPLITTAKSTLLVNVSRAITDYRAKLDTQYNEISGSSQKIQDENKELIEKNLANSQIAPLLKALEEQNKSLNGIEERNKAIEAKTTKQQDQLISIVDNINARDRILNALITDFNEADHSLENMSFSIEANYNPDAVEQVSASFNKTASSPFVKDGNVNLNKVFSDPGAFIRHMASGDQKLNRSSNVISVTKDVLMTVKEIRFVAKMEDDRIGGFSKSSMTAGKQALFALTLILADSDELWPLLIDQPEDDLDSRSVCDVIIKDLMERKRKRQIIMVTHNANLAIGADSEEIIVANRHGDDRPNKDGHMFAYLTGSLEYSKPWDDKNNIILDCGGIREHACWILDGGVDAFQKRKDKYRI